MTKKLSKKRQNELLRKARYFNAYMITKKGHPFLIQSSGNSRACKPTHWSVSIHGMEIKGGAWYEHGSKWFCYTGKEQKAQQKQAALDWIEERFPGMEMVHPPLSHSRSDLVPKEDLEAALAVAISKAEEEE